jgi:hypothetical protein
MEPTTGPGGHLSADAVAAYLDGRVPQDTRGTVEAHLALCRSCRDELGQAAGLLRRSRPARPIGRILIAAAAAATLILGIRSVPRRSAGPDFERSGEPATAGQLVLTPADDVTVPLRRIVLRWSAVAPRTSYRVTVTDSLGSTVWAGSSRDTAVVLPTPAPLISGRPYFWFVDALLPDGRRRSSGVNRIRAE